MCPHERGCVLARTDRVRASTHPTEAAVRASPRTLRRPSAIDNCWPERVKSRYSGVPGAVSLPLFSIIQLRESPTAMPRTRRSAEPYCFVPQDLEQTFAIDAGEALRRGGRFRPRLVRPDPLRAWVCLPADRLVARLRRRRASVAADDAPVELAELSGGGAARAAAARRGGGRAAVLRMAANRRSHPTGRAAGLRLRGTRQPAIPRRRRPGLPDGDRSRRNDGPADRLEPSQPVRRRDLVVRGVSQRRQAAGQPGGGAAAGRSSWPPTAAAGDIPPPRSAPTCGCSTRRASRSRCGNIPAAAS